jgi:hypothetical protein
MENEALGAELGRAMQQLDALGARAVEATGRASDTERRLEAQLQLAKDAAASARRHESEARERAEAAVAVTRSLEHKLQHAESTVESLGLERQSILAKVATLEERCGTLADELGWVQADTGRRDAELVRLKAEAAWHSSGTPDGALANQLRHSMHDLVCLSAHALEALVGPSLHLALELACRARRSFLEERLGVAQSFDDALGRTRAYLVGSGLVAALELEGAVDARTLQLGLVPVSDADLPTRRWLAAYTVECINTCGADAFRVEGVEGNPQRFRVAAAIRSFNTPEVALRSA